MIYLIGGPPKCGKSTLARLLAQRTGASWVPLDSVESVIYHYLSADERATDVPLLPESTAEKYATASSHEIVANYRVRARTAWPAIQILIHFALAEHRELILEGFHIEPALLAEFLPAEQRPGAAAPSVSPYQAMMIQHGSGYALGHGSDPRLRAAFLVREDNADIAASVLAGTDDTSWVRREPLTDATALAIATVISDYGSAIRTDAEKYDLPVFNVDGAFEQRVAAILAYMLTPPTIQSA